MNSVQDFENLHVHVSLLITYHLWFYHLVQVISTCGGTISHHKFQIKYPLTGLYEAGKRCIWSTDFYFPLFVKNVFMDLEKSRYCKYDYVSIKSKYSTITPKKYCGNTRIRNPSVRGLVVEFHSDGSANRKGFRINGSKLFLRYYKGILEWY